MDKRKKITKSDNVIRQITEIKPLAEYLKQITSIPSVSRGLDRHLERMAYIPSVSKALDRHLEWMAAIPSVSRGLDRHLEQIASATATFDRLSKLEAPSSLIRTMAEANKSIPTMATENRLINPMTRVLGENQLQTQEIMKSLRSTFDMPAILSTSLAAQLKLSELQRFPLGAAIDATASLQDSLRLNLDKFTISYKNLVDFTDYQSSIIETLKSDIIQYPAREVFREAELLEQITVPEDEQVVLDEYEFIPIPEERPLEDRLGEINSSLPNLLQGAHAALNTDNPDRARHVASSLRELIGYILRQLAPEDKIRVWVTDSSYYHNGRPTRRTQLLYICREINFDHLSEFVDADVELALTLINALHAEAHVIDRRLTDRQLQGLVDRTESLLLFLLRLNSTNN